MRKVLLIAFALAAFAQLAIPLRMVWKAETTLHDGAVVRFQLQGVDPADPMRGKFIRLRYNWQHFELPKNESEHADKRLVVCAHVEVDDDGFGTLTKISLSPPETGLWFHLPARRNYKGSYRLQPTFDRYFVNEDDASEAEQQFFAALREQRATAPATARSAHAVLRILDGEAQLEDVIIDGQSLAQLAREANGD